MPSLLFSLTRPILPLHHLTGSSWGHVLSKSPARGPWSQSLLLGSIGHPAGTRKKTCNLFKDPTLNPTEEQEATLEEMELRRSASLGSECWSFTNTTRE